MLRITRQAFCPIFAKIKLANMRFTKLLSLTCLLLSTLFIGSCKKETNIINPVQTFQYTIHSNSWQKASDPAYGNGFGIAIPVPEITDATVDAGAVIVYLSLDGGKTFEAIPEVINGVTYLTSHSTGYLYLEMYEAYGGDLTSPFSGDIIAKVVIQNP